MSVPLSRIPASPRARGARARRAALAFAAVACAGLVGGCASTKVATTGEGARTPLCQPPGARQHALVLWGTRWRPDQKDVREREDFARSGLQDYFRANRCFDRVDLRRLAGGREAVVPDDGALVALAANAKPPVDRVVVIVVRELGPVVKIGTGSGVEGGTEVVLELRALALPAGNVVASTRTHWQNGGAGVIKGQATLRADMRDAVAAAFDPAVAATR